MIAGVPKGRFPRGGVVSVYSHSKEARSVWFKPIPAVKEERRDVVPPRRNSLALSSNPRSLVAARTKENVNVLFFIVVDVCMFLPNAIGSSHGTLDDPVVRVPPDWIMKPLWKIERVSSIEEVASRETQPRSPAHPLAPPSRWSILALSSLMNALVSRIHH